MADFSIKQHDTQPSIQGTLTSDGVAVELVGTEVVTFVMRPARSRRCCESPSQVREPVVVGVGAIVDAENGIVRYNWQSGDTTVAGRFEAEFKISSGASVTTYPDSSYISITIHPDVS